MNEKLDPKKLVEQDPEFEKYLRDACYAFMMNDKNSKALISSIYSFYQIGTSEADLIRWIRSIRAFEDDDNS